MITLKDAVTSEVIGKSNPPVYPRESESVYVGEQRYVVTQVEYRLTVNFTHTETVVWVAKR